MEHAKSKSLNIIQLVNWYMTPMAFVIILAAGIFLGWDKFTGTALAIVCMTVAANVMFVYVAGQLPDHVVLIRSWRMALNYMCNAALVFLLLPRWTPVWMLFLLAVIAGALYSDRKGTMLHAGACSILLLAIQSLYSRMSRPLMGETLMYVTVFWAIGLLVNSIVHPTEVGTQ
jgi:hypothetical protein